VSRSARNVADARPRLSSSPRGRRDHLGQVEKQQRNCAIGMFGVCGRHPVDHQVGRVAPPSAVTFTPAEDNGFRTASPSWRLHVSRLVPRILAA